MQGVCSGPTCASFPPKPGTHLSRDEVQGIVLGRRSLLLGGPFPSRALGPHVSDPPHPHTAHPRRKKVGGPTARRIIRTDGAGAAASRLSCAAGTTDGSGQTPKAPTRERRARAPYLLSLFFNVFLCFCQHVRFVVRLRAEAFACIR